MNKYKILKTNDKDKEESIREALKSNEGYCPCAITKNDDTKCMCKEFRERDCEGYCRCGLYMKVIQ